MLLFVTTEFTPTERMASHFFAQTENRQGSIPQMHPCMHDIKKASFQGQEIY